jgi:hypothetical protein
MEKEDGKRMLGLASKARDDERPQGRLGSCAWLPSKDKKKEKKAAHSFQALIINFGRLWTVLFSGFLPYERKEREKTWRKQKSKEQVQSSSLAMERSASEGGPS